MKKIIYFSLLSLIYSGTCSSMERPVPSTSSEYEDFFDELSDLVNEPSLLSEAATSAQINDTINSKIESEPAPSAPATPAIELGRPKRRQNSVQTNDVSNSKAESEVMIQCIKKYSSRQRKVICVYECLKCGHRSPHLHNVNQHILAIHEQLKPYKCPCKVDGIPCEHSSSRKNDIDKHMRRWHPHQRLQVLELSPEDKAEIQEKLKRYRKS